MKSDAETRNSRRRALVFLLLVAGMIGSMFAFVHPWYDRTNDGSTYIITARAIADGEGYSYLGDTFRVRPPGFSYLTALADPDGTNFGILNMMVTLFGIVGVALLYLYLRPTLGQPLAWLTAAALWLNPGFRRLCTEVMSDVPGLALVLACLLLDRWASRRPSWKRELLLGLAIGLAAYVRSTAILLVPAIVLARVLARFRPSDEPVPGSPDQGGLGRFVVERILVVAVVAWLVLLPWSVARRSGAPPPPADQTLNYSLATAMWHEDPGDPGSRRYGPGEILARIPPRLHEVGIVLGSRLQHRIPGSPPLDARADLAFLVVALVMAGCWLAVLIRRRAAADWFVAGVALVVAVYFIFTDRLALPIYVFALAATVEVLRDRARRLVGPRAATIVPAAVLLLLIAVDWPPRRDWDEIRARHQAFVELAAAVESTLADDARLAAGQGFHYGVYLDRPVYSLIHGVRRAGRPDAAEEIIDKYGINTVVLSPLVPPDLALAPYFRRRYGPGTPAGPARVWRVRSE